MSKKVIIILGTTASGKTKIGVKLARDFNGEIISADSRQVYQGMDIGTGKDLEEYNLTSYTKNKRKKKITKKIPYHLIDILSPKKQFTLADWLKSTHYCIENILKRKKNPIIVGGTALYLNALIQGYCLPLAKLDKKLRAELNKLSLEKLLTKLQKLDPQTYSIIDKKNRRRVQRALEVILQTKKPLTQQRKTKKPKYDFLVLGITYPRKKLNQRIDQRVDLRLKQGMVQEVKKLHQQKVSWKKLEEFGLEYRFIAQYLQKKLDYSKMIEKLKIAIHQFAKRQMTWFKKMKNIHWIKNYQETKKLVKQFLD